MDEQPRRRPGPAPRLNPEGERHHIDTIVSADLRRRIRLAAAAADLGMGEWMRLAAEEKLAREHH